MLRPTRTVAVSAWRLAGVLAYFVELSIVDYADLLYEPFAGNSLIVHESFPKLTLKYSR